jgi:hypothetical protein
MEAARRLIALGETVETVLMIEPVSFNARPTLQFIARVLGLSSEVSRSRTENRWRRRVMHGLWALLMKGNSYVERAQIFRALPREVQLKKLGRKLRAVMARVRAIFGAHGPAQSQPHGRDPSDSVELWDTEVWRSQGRALAAYVPRLPPTHVICYVGKTTPGFKFSPKAWKRLGPIEIAEVPGEHMTCITTHATALAESMRRDLASNVPADRLRIYRRIAEPRNNAVTGVQ